MPAPQAITAAAADADREQLYVGLPSGEVKLYDLTSGRETRTFTGHGEPITGEWWAQRANHRRVVGTKSQSQVRGGRR